MRYCLIVALLALVVDNFLGVVDLNRWNLALLKTQHTHTHTHTHLQALSCSHTISFPRPFSFSHPFHSASAETILATRGSVPSPRRWGVIPPSSHWGELHLFLSRSPSPLASLSISLCHEHVSHSFSSVRKFLFPSNMCQFHKHVICFLNLMLPNTFSLFNSQLSYPRFLISLSMHSHLALITHHNHSCACFHLPFSLVAIHIQIPLVCLDACEHMLII